MASTSRRASTLIQLAGNVSFVGLALVQGLILVPFYLYYLGTETYGTWLALGNFISLFALADLGITNFATQRSALYSAGKDYKALASLIAALALFDLVASVLIIVAGLLFADDLALWFGVAGDQLPSMTMAFMVACVDVALMLLTSLTGAILFGLQRPGGHTIAQLVGTLLTMLLTIVMLQRGFGVLAIPVALLARPLLMLPVNLTTLVRALRPHLSLAAFRPTRAMLGECFRAGFWLGPAKLAEALLGQVDNIVVIKFLGPAEVAMLSVTRKASQLVTLVLGRFSASMMSGLAHLHGAGEAKRLTEIVQTLFVVSGLVGTVGYVAVALFNRAFITLWVGEALYAGFLVSALAAAYEFVRLAKVTIFNAVIAHGEIKAVASSSLVECVLHVLLSIALVTMLGLPGLVLSALLAVIVGCLVQAKPLLARAYATPNELRFGMLRIAALGIFSIVVGVVFLRAIPPISWMTFLSVCLGYLAVAILPLLPSLPHLLRRVRQ